MATGTSQGQLFGTIQSVSGSARVIGVDGSVRKAVAGAKIFNNEMILTNANASVKLQLGNGQTVDIVGGSEYQVGVDAAPGAGGAEESGGGSAVVTEQGAPAAGVTAGFGTEPIGGRVIGTVADTSGQATATSPDGSVRILGVGDKVFANETVTSSSGGPVNISLAGGGSLECGPGASLTLNPNLLSVGKATGGIADIQAAILAGADPTQVADPTAAGAPAAGGTDEGAGGSHKIIVLDQANSSIDITAGFATFGAGIGFPNFEFQLLAAGEVKPIASLLPLGPTVIEGTDGGSSHVIHFTIQLDKTVPVNVGINFLITPPGADGNGADVSSPLAGTAVILAGSNSVVVDVAIVQDHFVEFNEPFSITLTDAINATIDPAADTATITIIDDDANPVAVDDTNWVQEDSAVTATGNVLENHNHPGAPSGAFADVQDVDTDPLQVTNVNPITGTYGSLVLNADGSYTYQLYTAAENATANAIVQALDSNDAALIDTFTYTVTDGFNTPDTATLNISVFGSNDGPGIIVTDASGGVHDVYEAGLPAGSDVGPTTTEVTGSFTLSDPDGLDDLDAIKVDGSTFSIAQLSAATDTVAGRLLVADTSAGALFVTGYNGSTGVVSYRYVLDTATAQADATSQNVFQVSVSDDGVNFTAPVAVTVTIHDDQPAASPDTNTVAEDTLLVASGNVLANDTSNADTPKSLLAWGSEAAQYGTLTKNADGSYVYTLNNDLNAVQGLSVGQSLTETFTYTMKDADGDTSSSTLTITITGTDDGVPIVGIGAEGGDEVVFENDLADGSSPDAAALTQTGSFTIDAKDGIAVVQVGDDITGATLTVSQLLNSATYPVSIDTAAGVLVITGYSGNEFGGTVSYAYTLQDDVTHATGAGANNAFDNFAVSVTDEDGSEANQVLSVRIVDDLPQAVNDGPFNVTEDALVTTVTGNAISNDHSFADDPASFVSWTSTTSTVLSQYGTLTLAPNGDYTFVLNNADADTQGLNTGETRTETFQYTMSDADGDTSTATLTITITGTEDGVTITGIGAEGGDQTVFENDLAVGSSPNAPALTQTGSFAITANDGIAEVKVGALTLTVGQLLNLSSANQTVDTDAGLLTLTGYTGNAQGGTVSYSYVLQDNVAHSTGGGTNDAFDNFAVSVADEDGSSSSSTLSVRIVDDVPTSRSEQDSLQEDGPLTADGNVITSFGGADANITDGVADTPGADGIASINWTGAVGGQVAGGYGSLAVGSDGSYTYTLNNGTNGVDGVVQTLAQGETVTETFNYTITDGDGDSSTSTLTITITGTNDAPVDGNETGNVVEDGTQTASGIMLANATDIDNGATLDVTLNSSTAGTYGSLTSFNSDTGAYTYTLNNGTNGVDGVVQTLAQGETVTDVFNYTVVDEFGATNTSTLTITITGTNDAPVDGNETGNVVEDGTQTASGIMLANATDIDNGATLDVTLNSSTAGTYGSLTSFNSDTGAYTYTLNNGTNGVDGVVQTLAQGETVTDVFNYTVVDEFGATNTSTLTITITGTNDAPVDGNETGNVVEDGTQTASGIMLANATDIDNGATLDVTLNSSTAGTYGSLTSFNSDTGAYTYTLNNGTNGVDGVVQTLAQGETVTDVFNYTVVDEFGATNTSTLTITITGTNDAPVDGNETGNVVEDGTQTASGIMLANATDIDNGATLDVTLNSSTAGTYGSLTSFNSDTGAYTYTLNNGTNGVDGVVQTLAQGETVTDVFNYTVVDEFGATNTSTLTITITGTNDAPVDGNETGNVVEDGTQTASGIMLANATDIDNGATLDVTLNSSTAGTYGSLTSFNSDTGAYTYTLNNGTNGVDGVVQTLAQGETVTDVFNYTVVDEFGATNTSTLTITITGTNDAPVDGNETGNVVEDGTQTASGIMLANATDIDNGATLDVTLNSSTAGTYGSLTSFNSDTGAYTYTLNNGTNGVDGVVQTLAQGETVTDVFNYTVVDEFGATNTSTLTITITGTNDAPVDGNEGNGVTEGVTPVANGNVLDNATDIDNGATLDVTLNSSTAGTYGSLTSFNSDTGAYTYTLNGNVDLPEGQTVTDIFNYTVVDEFGATNTSTLTITITGDNDAPVDDNEGNNVTEDGTQTASGNVLANATDSDNDDLDATLTSSTNGTYGSLTAFDSETGAYTYTLNNGTNGVDGVVQTLAQGETVTDVFNYTVVDEFGATNTSTLTITITGTNDAPVDGNETGNVVEDGTQTASGIMLANATDIDNGATLDVTLNSSTAGTYGSLTSFNSDTGAYTYTLNNGTNGVDGVVQTLAQGETVTDVFNYTVVDEFGATNTSTLTITITGTNDAPVDGNETGNVVEDGTQTASGIMLANATDIDNGATLDVTLNSSTAGTYGSLTSFNSDTGAYTYTLNNGTNGVDGVVQTLAQGETVTDVFNYTVVDEFGATNTSTLTITITGTNDAPVDGNETGNVVEDGTQTASGIMLANATDIDNGATLDVTLNSSTAGTYGSLTSFNSDTGAYTYTLNNGTNGVDGVVQTLAQGETVTDVFNYTVVDEFGATNTSTLTITITGTNDAPVDGNETGNVVEDGTQTASGIMLANATDIDNGATLDVTLNSSTAGTYGSLTSFNSDTGAYTYTLNNGTNGVDGVVQTLAQGETVTDVFNYTVVDEFGATNTSTLTITITGTNDAPVDGNETGNVVEDGTQTASGIMLANATDIDNGATLDVTLNSSTAGTYGSLTSFNSDTGAYTYTLNNGTNGVDGVVQTLAQGETVTDVFNYTVVDEFGATNTSTLTITITGTNDAPVDGNETGNVVEDGTQTASGIMLANATDIDNGATLDVTLNSSTAGTYGSLTSFNSDTGAYTYTLNNGTNGVDGVVQTLAQGETVTDVFNYTVVDEFGATNTSTLTITITGTNDAPVDGNETGNVVEDGTQTASGIMLANATDIDNGATLDVTLNSSTAGTYGSLTSFNSDTGAYTYTLNNGTNGVDGVVQTLAQGETVTDVFNYTVVDEFGATNTSTLTITITGTNDAPVDGNEGNGVTEGVTPVANGNVLDNATDIDNGATLDVTLNSSTAGTYGSLTSFNSDTGAYTYTLNGNVDLPEGQTVTDIFNYTVVDEFGATNTSTLTITITGDNDAPVDDNEGNNVTEDGTQTASGNVLANATDSDNDDLDATLTSSTNGTYGSLTAFDSETGAYTYTLNNGTNGVDGVVQTLAQGETVTDVFNYTVVDEFGATNTSTLTITITGTNDAPVDGNETGNVVEDGTQTASGIMLANATDIDNGATLDVTLNSSTAGTYGSLTSFNSDTGAYTYTLNNGTNGVDGVVQTLAQGETVTDVFNYTVVDEFGATNTSTLTITITGTNDAPVDGNETGNVVEDGTQTASGIMLANATDIDNGATLDVTLNSSTAGTYGSLTSFNSDTGAYTYTLNNGTNGVDGVVQTLAQGETVTDVFNYTVVDEFGATNTSTLTITITGTNDAPVDGNETGNVVEDGTQTASGIMLANATDIDNGATLDVTLNSSTAGTYGSLTSFNSDTGAYTYTLNNGTNGVDGVVQTLAQGETVTDVFNYTVVDEFGATNTSTLTITITGTNDAPVDGNETGNVVEDGTQTASGIMLANATDIDNGATLDVTLNSSTAGTYGSLTSFNSDTGAYTYTLNNGTNGVDGVVQTLAQGETVTDVFNYTVVDEFGATNTSTLTITITGTNDAPVDGNETGNVVEDGTQTASGIMLANATDIDNGATLDVTLNSSTAGTYGSLTSFNSDTGAYTYTLNNGTNGVDGVVQTLAQGETVTDVFNYTVVDEFGATNTSTLTITITGTNDAPVDGNETGNVVEDGTQTASGIMLANATDIDNGATLDVTLNSSTAGTYGSLTSFNSDTGAYTYTLNNGTNGVDGVVQTLAQGETVTDVFNYTVVDEFGATNTSTLTITITGTNDAPVDGNETGNVVEDGTQTASGIMLANATDIDNGATLDVTLNSSTAGTYGSLTSFNSDTGAYTYTLNNGTNGVDGVVQTLAQGETVTDVFNYTVVDEFGATNTSTLTITITGTNDAPVDGNETGNVVEDGTQTASGIMLANATDIDNGATLDVTLNSSTAGTYGSLTSFNSDTGAYTYTLNNGTNGVDGVVQTLAQGETVTDVFNYTVVDEFGATNTSTLTITITGTNDAPVVVSSENWLPSDPAQQVPGYTDGYQLLITLPTDIDNGTNLVIKTTGTVPAGVFYFNGSTYVALPINFTLYDPANSIDLLDNVVYRPTANVTDTVNVTLTLDVYDGFVHLPQTVAIHELPPNRLPSETSTIGDGEHPLTSGQDQVANLVLTQGFINGIPDFHEATISVFTDFQKAPFVLAIPPTERDPGAFNDSSAGSHREQEVQVELRIGAVRFAIVEDDLTVGTFEQSWVFDADTGLMRADVDYDDIHLLDASGNATSTTLAQYLIANPPTAGSSWTLVYDDNDGGSYEARTVHFEFFSHDPGDPGILVNGSSTLPDQIYGTGGVDNLSGNGGNDVIFARADNDFVSGGTGNDTLSGGSGNDILSGGSGTDLFVWLNGNQGSVGAAAADTVQDFAAGDVLDLQDLLPDGPDLSNYLSVTQSGSTVTVHVTNGASNLPVNDVQTIVLTGYAAESVGNILNELIANQTYVGKV